MPYFLSREVPRALLTLSLMLSGCSDDSAGNKDAGPPDGAVTHDRGPSGDLRQAVDQTEAPTIPAVPKQSGVVYVAHFHTPELRYYRLDGTNPRQEGQIDLGDMTHEMIGDPYNDLLFVAADVGRTVKIYKLTRPQSVSAALTAPQLAGTITLTDEAPRFLAVNTVTRRLYIVASPSGSSQVDEFTLHTYDYSTPSAPKVVGQPRKVPTTSTFTVDSARNVLFLVHNKTRELHIYDLHGDNATPLANSPIALQPLFKGDNQYAFQIRNLVADMHRNRLYAARTQGALSELMVLEYPKALPTATQSYGQSVDFKLSVVADPFDVSLDPDSRPHLLDAFTPAVDFERGNVFLAAGAHSGTGVSGLVSAISPTMQLGVGCDHYESFGCWYQSYVGGSPSGKQVTDGAACVDYTHRIFVGTTYDVVNEMDPGGLVLFSYTDTLTMAAVNEADGSTLTAGGLPVAAVCH